jgi:hypothetical protein
MTDADRLHEMIAELRRMREQCEPKSNQNPRYLRYSNAASALRWIIDDLVLQPHGVILVDDLGDVARRHRIGETKVDHVAALSGRDSVPARALVDAGVIHLGQGGRPLMPLIDSGPVADCVIDLVRDPAGRSLCL